MADAKFTIRADDRTKAAFKSVRNSISGVTGSIFKAHVAITGLLGATGFGALVKTKAEAARVARNYADALGVNVQQLSALSIAASEANIEQEKFADILRDVSEKIGDAYATGGGEAVDALARLNLNAADLVNLAPDQQLLAIAGALDEVGSKSERIFVLESLASDLSELAPLLENDAERLLALRDRAIETGAAFNEVATDKLVKANEGFRDLEMAISGLGTTLAVELAEPLAEFTQDISNNLPAAINSARFTLNTLELGFLGVAESIESVIAWRAEMDENLLKKVPGAERFFEKFFDYDPDAKERALNDLNETRQAIIRVQKEQQALIDEPFRRIFDAGTSSGITIRGRAEGAGAGGADQDKQRQALQAYELGLLQEVAALEESFRTKEQVEIEAFERRQLMIEEAAAREIIGAQRKNQILENLEAEHQQKISAMKQAAIQRNLGVASDFFGSFAQLAQQGGEKYFGLWKNLARAQAIVDTYAGATAAYKAMAGIPVVGPALGAAAAAAAVASGLARVAAINQTSLTSQAAGNVPSPGGTGAGGGVPAAVPTTSSRQNDRPVQQIEIHVHGDMDDLSKLARSLRPYNIELAERDIV